MTPKYTPFDNPEQLVPQLRALDLRRPIPGLPETLIELHLHLGGAVAPHVLWSMAHEQGFKLPVKDYFEFVDLISSSPDKVQNLEDYLRIMHEWTERIQSSPQAIERAVYEVFAKEYRGARVRQMELRFNPMKRNLDGERDMDHIILAALRGLDQACLEYNLKGGLIFCLAREFPADLNEIIVTKAIQWAHRGVVGIDLAGTEARYLELRPDSLLRFKGMFERAKAHGLYTTIHTGETQSTDAAGVIKAVRDLGAHRIGHGIRAAYNEEAMKLLREENVALEICPTSNLHTRAVNSLEELRHILTVFKDRRVPFTINTDATYMLQTDLRREVELLTASGILTAEDVAQCFETAKAHAFLKN